MSLVGIAVRRPVATAMVFLAVVLLGLVSSRRLEVELLPDIGYPRLSVITRFPGVAPAEMETLVTRPLETAAGRIPGLRRTESRSREGLSFLTLEFAWGKDMDLALLQAREALDIGRGSLPQEAGTPVIVPLDPTESPILILAVTGARTPRDLRDFCERVVKPRLEQVEGIGQAEVGGGDIREIEIEIDPDRAALYGLTPEGIARTLDDANRELRGGVLRSGPFRHALRVTGGITDLDDFGGTILHATGRGGVVRLNDVGRVVDSVRERQGLVRLDGAECVSVLVRRASGANTLRVTRAAKEVLAEIRREAPALGIRIVSEQSGLIEDAVATAKEEIIGGGLLAFLVLLLFLQDVRTPLIIGAVFPVAVIAALALADLSGISLNVMSLGGLALGVGLLDDCAVVVSENIFRHGSLGEDAVEAAINGASEVGAAVSATALTTIVVFLPIVYVRGIAGPLFRDAALTVTYSVLLSLLASLTLLPMLTARAWKRPDARSGSGASRGKGPVSAASRRSRPSVKALGRGFRAAYERFASRYRRALVLCLENKGAVLLASLGILLPVAIAGTNVRRELMPKLGTRSFEVLVAAPASCSLEETSRLAASAERWLSGRPETRMTFSRVGLAGGWEGFDPEAAPNSARLLVEASSTDACERLIDALGRALPSSSGASFELRRERSDSVRSLALSGPDLDLRVRGDSLDKLAATARRLVSRLRRIPGIVEPKADDTEGKPELVVRVRDDILSRYPGLTPAVVADRVVEFARGRAATSSFRESDKAHEIRIRLAAAGGPDLNGLLDAFVASGRALIPLRELVSFEVLSGPREVRRGDRQREVQLTASFRGRTASRIIPEVRAAVANTSLPPGTRIVFGGEREEMARSFRSLLAAFLLAVLLDYMIMAAQFESLRHPLIILAAVPFGLCGSVMAMLITRTTLNVVSAIGMIVLLGIVVDNAIVEIDVLNRLRRQGRGLRESVVEGCGLRLRPILMSTATTLIALVPMSLGIGRGAELLRPLGIVVLGGLAMATFLTLFLVPVIYEAVEAGRGRAE